MTTHIRLTHTVLACLLLTLSAQTAWAAQTSYKCKNSDGRTSYTATPALGQQCVAMNLSGTAPATRSPSPAAKPSSAKAPSAKGTDAAASAAAEATAAKAPATDAECAATRDNQTVLQSGMRVFEKDSKGERSYMDDAQRSARLKEYQQILNTRCKR